MLIFNNGSSGGKQADVVRIQALGRGRGDERGRSSNDDGRGGHVERE